MEKFYFQKLMLSCLGYFLISADAFSAANLDQTNLSQIDAMAEAHIINKRGSDQSLQESTSNAMRALMNLANQNRSGAISNGYRAFGQYRNSGDLDGLRIQNATNALKLDSGGVIKKGSKAEVFLTPISEYETSYRRLDPSFLRQGEAGKVAEQFEKATGMSRETFLKKMVNASESKIQVSDPKLIDKVLTRFEGFVKEIPNEEFRKKVETEIAAVPDTMRTGVISKAVQKFTVLFAGAEVAPKNSALALAAKPASPPATPQSGGSAKESIPAKNQPTSPSESLEARKLSSAESFKPQSDLSAKPEFRGLAMEQLSSDGMGSVLQGAMEDQKDETIFKQVSRKYRSLAASLKQNAI